MDDFGLICKSYVAPSQMGAVLYTVAVLMLSKSLDERFGVLRNQIYSLCDRVAELVAMEDTSVSKPYRCQGKGEGSSAGRSCFLIWDFCLGPEVAS